MTSLKYNVLEDPRDNLEERSIDYGELSEVEFRQGMGIAVLDPIPEPDGSNERGDWWDNEFGAFYRRPDGSFYYN